MREPDLSAIAMMIFDVDGVLTDGRIFYDATGEPLKAFSTLDGLGLKLLQKSGVDIAVITGRNSPALHRRLDDLGVADRYVGIDDKAVAYRDLLARKRLEPRQTGFMGDDIVDLPVMLCCGWAVTVPEAPQIVRQHAHWTTERAGGMGAVREACERLMRAQSTWDMAMVRFLTPAVATID